MSECITGPTGPTGNGIKYSFIDSCHQLVFVYDDNYQSTLSSVLGPTGSSGPTGPTGPIGASGIGIQLVYLDTCCNLIVVLSDGSTINAGNYASCGGSTGTSNSVYYGFLPANGNVWPQGTSPPPTTSVPPLGSVYVNLSNGILFSFNGVSWIYTTSSGTGTPIVNPNGGILYYGPNTIAGTTTWPPETDITPTPTGLSPIEGSVYMNDISGQMYLYGNSWVELQSGNMPKFRSKTMTAHITPSTNTDGYGITLGNIITNDNTFSLMTSSNANLTVSLAGFTNLNQVPNNSSYLICNVSGIYNIQMAINSLDFGPQSLPLPGDIALYVIKSSGLYTFQSMGPSSIASFSLNAGDWLVIYANANNNALPAYDITNNNAYLEIVRRF